MRDFLYGSQKSAFPVLYRLCNHCSKSEGRIIYEELSGFVDSLCIGLHRISPSGNHNERMGMKLQTGNLRKYHLRLCIRGMRRKSLSLINEGADINAKWSRKNDPSKITHGWYGCAPLHVAVARASCLLRLVIRRDQDLHGNAETHSG